MPIIGLWDPSNLFVSRRAASTPPPRTGPARVHVERFSPKGGAASKARRDLPFDLDATDPITPITSPPSDDE